MKKSLVIAIMGFSMMITSATATAGCKAEYMNDPCEIDGYGIMEIERFEKGRHNHMEVLHHGFRSQKK